MFTKRMLRYYRRRRFIKEAFRRIDEAAARAKLEVINTPDNDWAHFDGTISLVLRKPNEVWVQRLYIVV